MKLVSIYSTIKMMHGPINIRLPVLFHTLALFHPILLDVTTPITIEEYKLPRVRRFKSPTVPRITPPLGLADQPAQHYNLYQHRFQNHRTRKPFLTYSVTSSAEKSGNISVIFAD